MDFRGFDKVGLDSSAFIALVGCPSNLEDFKAKFYSVKEIFYYASISQKEFMGVLINRHFFDATEVRESWKRISNELNLNLISWNDKNRGPYKNKVKAANNFLVKQENNESLRIGKPDLEIIASFLKEGIKKAYTLDRAFAKTCEILGIKINNLPEEYAKKIVEIRRINEKIFKKNEFGDDKNG